MTTLFEEVSKTAEESNKGSHMSFSRSDFYPAEVRGLFGRDAGVDYARHIYRDLENFIREESKRRRLNITFSPPVQGPSAREGFVEELKALLPGFGIDSTIHNVTVTWATTAVTRVQSE